MVDGIGAAVHLEDDAAGETAAMHFVDEISGPAAPDWTIEWEVVILK